MRRTMSLDAIIGPYLQGHWPKEPEGPSCVPRQDKSTQVSATGNNAFKCGNYECQKNEWNGIYQWCFLNLELLFFFLFFVYVSQFCFCFFWGGGGIEVRSHHKISLHFLQRNKLLWGWGREGGGRGVSGACTAITEWELQPRQQSPKSADEAFLAAPILSAPCRHSPLHFGCPHPSLPPSVFVFQFLLLFSSSASLTSLWVWMVRCGCTLAF